MPNLLEDPTPIISFGVIALVILGVTLAWTGRGFLLWIMAAVIALCGLGVLIERLVVTERERVKMVFEEGRQAVTANDLKRTLALVDPKYTEAVQFVEAAMRRYEFHSAKIGSLEIEINDAARPLTARANVSGSAGFRDRQGQFPYDGYPARLEVELRKEGDRWLITRVEEKRLLRPYSRGAWCFTQRRKAAKRGGATDGTPMKHG